MNQDKTTNEAINHIPQTDKSNEDNVLDLDYREQIKIRFLADLIDLKDDLYIGTWYYHFVEEFGPTLLKDFIRRLALVIPVSKLEKVDWFISVQVSDVIYELRDNHLFRDCDCEP